LSGNWPTGATLSLRAPSVGQAEGLWRRREKIPELLEKLPVAREVACCIFLSHLLEWGACSLKRIVARSGLSSAGRGRSRADKEALGLRQGGACPLDLAIIGKSCPNTRDRARP
jgi:hypothetical protein